MCTGGLAHCRDDSAVRGVRAPRGAWVDRLPLRPLLVTTDVIRSALLLSLPVAYWAGHLTLAHLFAVAFGAGVATVFFDIAYQSYLPALLPRRQLPAGNTALEMVHSTMQLAGPGVGGWLVAVASAPAALLVDAVSFLGSALFLGRIPSTRRPPVQDRKRLRTEILVGVQFVLTHPLLRLIVLRSVLANLAFAAVVAAQALYLLRVPGSPRSNTGWRWRPGPGRPRRWGALPTPRSPAGLRPHPGAGAGGLLARCVPAPRRRTGLARCRCGAGHAHRGCGSRALQHRAGQLPPGCDARRTTGPDERVGPILVWGAMPVGGLLGGLLAAPSGSGTRSSPPCPLRCCLRCRSCCRPERGVCATSLRDPRRPSTWADCGTCWVTVHDQSFAPGRGRRLLPDAATLSDRPPAEYAVLRERAPLVRARFRGKPIWLVTRHAAARHVLTSSVISTDPTRPGHPFAEMVGSDQEQAGQFIDMDPPRHGLSPAAGHQRVLPPPFAGATPADCDHRPGRHR